MMEIPGYCRFEAKRLLLVAGRGLLELAVTVVSARNATDMKAINNLFLIEFLRV